ncbi:hypothetical protein [Hafnia paralvei]|mgnify:CR=1 FL=1|uniref:hypothetical protein n=1 Tax=Hafnia paralvei TaxID=546367 RepID=UPI0024A7BF88|nr:hypothetical protein [Hafnia paralvei]
MNNLPIQTYESVVQQRDALAAENANLKEVLGEIPKSLFKHVNGDTYEWQIRTKSPEEMIKEALSETPATDAFTRELMAKGVEEFSDNQMQKSLEQRAIGNPVLSDIYNDNAMDAKVFAARIRKGINDAQ